MNGNTEKRCDVFVNNVRFLLKGSGMVLETEKEMGLSQGYFSRQRGNKLKLCVALEVADRLGYSIDQLCDPNLTKVMQIENIDKMIDQLEKKKAYLMEE